VAGRHAVGEQVGCLRQAMVGEPGHLGGRQFLFDRRPAAGGEQLLGLRKGRIPAADGGEQFDQRAAKDPQRLGVAE
jgi:hypothetical protein